MKYYMLKKIVTYLNENTTVIKLIKRIDNNTIQIEFNNKNIIYFDLSKSNSLIYKKILDSNVKKDFSAPFDTILQKRFNGAKIENVTLHNDDKIIRFYVKSKSSYKELTTILQLEFTGKYTNIIILEDDEIILEALRHIDEFSSSRIVKVGEKLLEVPKQSFIPKMQDIDNVEEFLVNLYLKKEAKSLSVLKKVKIDSLKKSSNKIEKLLNSLAKKEELEEEARNLYSKANLILNNLYLIKPYQKTIKVFDYEGVEVELNLDTNEATPSVFANKLFKTAKKLKQKSKKISIEKDNLDEKRNFLQRMILNIENSSSIDEIEFLVPKKQKNQTKTKKSEQYEAFFFEGFKIMLGTSERENIWLLKNTKASDFWFHLKDRPSAHVFVQNSKKTIPLSVIEKASSICAKFSLDFSGNYLVDYTQRRNVKVQSGANVLYNPYTTIKVNI